MYDISIPKRYSIIPAVAQPLPFAKHPLVFSYTLRLLFLHSKRHLHSPIFPSNAAPKDNNTRMHSANPSNALHTCATHAHTRLSYAVLPDPRGHTAPTACRQVFWLAPIPPQPSRNEPNPSQWLFSASAFPGTHSNGLAQDSHLLPFSANGKPRPPFRHLQRAQMYNYFLTFLLHSLPINGCGCP